MVVMMELVVLGIQVQTNVHLTHLVVNYPNRFVQLIPMFVNGPVQEKRVVVETNNPIILFYKRNLDNNIAFLVDTIDVFFLYL
jgi:hypothetical protein